MMDKVLGAFYAAVPTALRGDAAIDEVYTVTPRFDARGALQSSLPLLFIPMMEKALIDRRAPESGARVTVEVHVMDKPRVIAAGVALTEKAETLLAELIAPAGYRIDDRVHELTRVGPAEDGDYTLGVLRFSYDVKAAGEI